MDNLGHCLNRYFANSEHHEIFYSLLHLNLVWMLLAICVSLALVALYKEHVTRYMASPSYGMGDPGEMRHALANPEKYGEPHLSIASTVELTSWTTISLYLKKQQKNTALVIGIHLSFLLVVIFIVNHDDIGESLYEAILGVAFLIGMLILMSTSVLRLTALDPIVMKFIWPVGVLLMIGQFIIEFQEDIDGDAELLFFYSTLLIIVFYLCMANRFIKNIAPQLAVTLLVASLLTFILTQIYYFSNCLIGMQDNEWVHLVAILFSVLAVFYFIKRIVQWVAIVYRHGGVSDRQIHLSCWLILVSVSLLVLVMEDDGNDTVTITPLALTIPLAALVSICLLLWSDRQIKQIQRPCELLLLRVFSSDRRGEMWLSEFEYYWRYLGPIHLIAGPDLVSSIVDTRKIYLFISGKIKTLFIHSRSIAKLRLSSIKIKPDPDGRYRVNEFYCFDDIWENVVNGLVRRSRFVVLDLRDFNLSRLGTAKEINFLSNSSSFDKTLILVDDKAQIQDLIILVQELTGLRISERQFCVAASNTALETIKKLLSLQTEKIVNDYSKTEASRADYYLDSGIQKSELISNCQRIIAFHRNEKYSFSIVVFGMGCLGLGTLFFPLSRTDTDLGMVAAIAPIFIYPFYLLIRGVSWRRVLPSLGSGVVLIVFSFLLVAKNEKVIASSPSIWSGLYLNFALIALALWLVVWIQTSQSANRWIVESREPVRNSLQVLKDNHVVQPKYNGGNQMNFIESISLALSKYATFKGRAGRSEFWWFNLFLTTFLMGIISLSPAFSSSMIAQIIEFFLLVAICIPWVTVAVRRLHDTDRTGWWYLIAFIPIVGTIVILVFFLQRGTPGPNSFGDNTKNNDT